LNLTFTIRLDLRRELRSYKFNLQQKNDLLLKYLNLDTDLKTISLDYQNN